MHPSSTSVAPQSEQHLVLVGGGHAHVQVLRRFLMEPPPGLRTTVVLDTPIAVYSGMVPGFVAGQYRAEELEIDVVPLARRAGAEIVLSAMTGVDADAGEIRFSERPPLRYDLASIDIGSTVAGLDLPGVRESAIPTRPIGRFVATVDGLLEDARALGGERPFRAIVVGGGAGGVELAFTLEHRLRTEGETVAVTLVHNRDALLSGFPPGLGRRAAREAEARGIELQHGVRVSGVVDGGVAIEGRSERLPFDALLWVTGAASYGILERSGLPTDARGFVRTRSTLQVVGHDTLFAVGDCATLEASPTPKAGVYAVRQGPVLTDNLLAAAAGRRLVEYRPQRDFLTLLNLGDGRALGAKWGVAFDGGWVMRLKDRIDRRFMERFRFLDREGAELEAAASMDPMDGADEMICGGCAAKLGRDALERALGRLDLPLPPPAVVVGAREAEDVVAHRTAGGDIVASSVDAFRPFSADPYLVGRVAAVNAASDLLAKGVAPLYAQALVAVPDRLTEEEREEFLYQNLSGALAAFGELDVTLLGGHTTTAPAPLIGFHVEGVAPESGLLGKQGARPGDRLVLTKPLGTGVVLYADMRGLARGPWVASAHRSMTATNARAAAAARQRGATAGTDVTGFGFAGHLADLLRSSGVSARIDVEALPALPGAVELLARGVRSTFHPENRKALRSIAVPAGLRDEPRLELLFDPQTSGGLLLALPPAEAEALVMDLTGPDLPAAAVVGEVTAATDGAFTLIG